MTLFSSLSPEEAQSSARLAELIREEITASGGWLSFARFMELALYAPGLGYYSGGAAKFGAAGDFVTAPEISALFGRTLARQAAQILEASGGDLLELGAGSGKLAFDLLGELQHLDRLPRRYYILEVSADLRQRQGERLAPYAERVEWLDALPDAFTGLILGNEVLDALPVHLVEWRADGLAERGVVWRDEGFEWANRPLKDSPLHDVAAQLALPAGYRSEIGLAAQGLLATLAERLERGAALFIDYGFGAREYYHPQRSDGTLMCHFRHRAHDDPLAYPGVQDLTAHVDFSAIAAAGVAHGLALAGYTSQAHFLLNCGLTDLLGETSPEQAGTYLPLAAQAQKLVSPAEMGELFKVIAFAKGLEIPLCGFARGDKRHTL
ncbi:MAG: SAM-dependent methyltransferase [Sulfuricella sp.]|nr:SAM-dependent methyltransferase [Sulfuricella sp.]